MCCTTSLKLDTGLTFGQNIVMYPIAPVGRLQNVFLMQWRIAIRPYDCIFMVYVGRALPHRQKCPPQIYHTLVKIDARCKIRAGTGTCPYNCIFDKGRTHGSVPTVGTEYSRCSPSPLGGKVGKGGYRKSMFIPENHKVADGFVAQCPYVGAALLFVELEKDGHTGPPLW